jgi:hypothetical protein
MKPRNLFVAAFVLAALSGAVWYAQKHPPSSDSTNTPAAPKLADIPEKDVQSLDIKKKDGTEVSLKKVNTKWEITTPQEWRADQDATTSLVSALSPISADSVVEDKATDTAKYGLNSPSLVVTVHRANGKSDNIEFGDDVPAGSLVYARIDSDPKVYAVASSVKSSLDKSANDLRDKRLLTFDTNKLTRLELSAGKSDIEFGKNNQSEWQILKPAPYRADGSQVDDLIRKLGEAKMDLSDPAVEAKKSAAAYSAGVPDAIIKVSDSSGTQTLDVRKNKDDYYAKSSVVPGFYKLTGDLGKLVAKPLDDFRNKKLFDFGFSDPTKIAVQSSTGSSNLSRIGTDWKKDGKTLDPGTVQALIDKLRDLAAAKFASNGFTSAAVTLTVVSNDGKRTEKVELSKTSDGYLARREGDSSLYQLDAKSVNDILEANNAVKPAANAKK